MKLLITGASGSGVTTLGQLVAQTLNIVYVDCDTYFWVPTDPPFTQRRDPKERNQLIAECLGQTEDWVLGGSVIHWGDHVFPDFDLIVFLYLPKDIRIERLKRREWARYGDVIYTNKERSAQFNKFLIWASDYDEGTGVANRTLQAHRAWLTQARCPVIEIVGDKTLEEKLGIIMEKLATTGTRS